LATFSCYLAIANFAQWRYNVYRIWHLLNSKNSSIGKGDFEMVKLQKKQVKIVSVLIALAFVGSVVAMALTQFGPNMASAASSNVGVVDYSQIMSQHPQVQAASNEMQTAVQEAQKEFEEKSANMNDNEKRDYYTQTQQRLQQKNQELMEPITKSVEDSVKKVAEQKGLSVVLDKGAVVYGGVDITQDVLKQVSK